MPSESIKPNRRAETLRAAQALKMARSAHAYVRGSTARFYDWLADQKRGTLPEGPAIWICGDCHVGNLGPVAASDGRIGFQIRDFDQTVIGNPAHDLIRLALSLATAARGSDLPGVTAAHILEGIVEGYRAALLRDPDSIEAPPRPVRATMRRSVARTWKHLARDRLKQVRPRIPQGKRFWPLRQSEQAELRRLLRGPDLHALATALRSRDDDAPVELIDAAYWMKGCSSLGKLRFAALLQIGDGRDADYALMDFKEAVAPAAPRYPRVRMPRDNAERVVTGASHLAPNLGQRMVAARIAGSAVFVRELLPQDLKLEIDRLNRAEAVQSANFLASVVGKAHGRQMDAVTRQRWASELGRSRSKSLDAPSWLWSSVVALVGSHEIAYLEHCRRYAAGGAA